MRRGLLYLILTVVTVGNLQAQTVFGNWNTFDSETGRPNSVVEIYEKDGQVFGQIVRVIKEEDRNRKCVKCKGELKNQPIENLVILRDLEKDGKEYGGGVVVDPKTGKEYKCKIWLDEKDPNRLHVRGYVGFLYETRIWHRVK